MASVAGSLKAGQSALARGVAEGNWLETAVAISTSVVMRWVGVEFRR